MVTVGMPLWRAYFTLTKKANPSSPNGALRKVIWKTLTYRRSFSQTSHSLSSKPFKHRRSRTSQKSNSSRKSRSSQQYEHDVVRQSELDDIQPVHGLYQSVKKAFPSYYDNQVNATKSENKPSSSLPEKRRSYSESNKALQALSEEMQTLYDQTRAPGDLELARKECMKYLTSHLHEIDPGARLHIFGSSAAGLDTSCSDVDVGVELSENLNVSEFRTFMRSFRDLIRSSDLLSGTQVLSILGARVPILRLIAPVKGYLLHFDVSMHQEINVESYELLKEFCDIDPRVGAFLTYVKHWAKSHDICDAAKRTLGSYGWILMALSSLQQVEPPVLPVVEALREFEGKNMMSLGRLLHYFFGLLETKFESHEMAVDITHDCFVSRSNHEANAALVIRDPVMLSQNVSNVSPVKLKSILQNVHRTNQIMTTLERHKDDSSIPLLCKSTVREAPRVTAVKTMHFAEVLEEMFSRYEASERKKIRRRENPNAPSDSQFLPIKSIYHQILRMAEFDDREELDFVYKLRAWHAKKFLIRMLRENSDRFEEGRKLEWRPVRTDKNGGFHNKIGVEDGQDLSNTSVKHISRPNVENSAVDNDNISEIEDRIISQSKCPKQLIFRSKELHDFLHVEINLKN